MTEVEKAWAAYNATVEETRQRLFSHPFAHSGPDGGAQNRGAAWYYLQMVQQGAFNLYIAPRPAYPHLWVFYSPYEMTVTQSCPDFLHRKAMLDGRRTYRLWGRMGTTCWADLQLMRGFWGDEDTATLGNHLFERFERDADGRFEVILSASEHDGDWLRLDPDSPHNLIHIREAFGDWETEIPIEMHLEEVGQPDEALTPTEEDMAARLDCAARYIRRATDFCLDITRDTVKHAGGVNRLWALDAGTRQAEGGNPASYFFFMQCDLREDMALVLTLDVDARYWGLSLGDVWMRTVDFSYHQGSLNHAQSVADADGKVRLVLALEDPGVHNWIDVNRLWQTNMVLRIYGYRATPSATVAEVPLADLDAHLPAGTCRVDAGERARILSRRTRASLGRWGL